jgi:uncharacterized protein (TIGR03000 family)
MGHASSAHFSGQPGGFSGNAMHFNSFNNMNSFNHMNSFNNMNSFNHMNSFSHANHFDGHNNFDHRHNDFDHDRDDFHHRHNDFDHDRDDFRFRRFGRFGFFPYFAFSYPFYGYGGYGYSYPYADYGGYGYSYPYSDYGYDSYGDVPDYGGSDSYAPDTGPEYGPMPRSADISSRVTINAPAGAQVWVDGTSIGSISSTKVFRTPPLDPDRQYRYKIRATWPGADGRPVTQTQDVVFPAGEGVAVSFPGPAS